VGSQPGSIASVVKESPEPVRAPGLREALWFVKGWMSYNGDAEVENMPGEELHNSLICAIVSIPN
jgi:hypothetical protein